MLVRSSSWTVFLCLDRLLESAYLSPQNRHAKGLSFVCVRLCVLNAVLTLKLLVHPGKSHTNGLERVWVVR